ncbi:MAG: hypothetical protein GY754_44035 [bacterium]|nr:hypothetical protein [bacterium]
MKIDFVAPAILVKDIGISKKFYTEVLGQEVEMDNGEHVSFIAGFSIWQRDHAYSLIYTGKTFSGNASEKDFELYFETTELEAVWDFLVKEDVEQLHDVHEHPWGQRGFRVYDPDGHIVEISEPLSAVVARFQKEGLSIKEISERTSIPEEMVRGLGSARTPGA